MSDWSPRSISVVIPVYDEEPNVRRLVEEIVGVLRPLGLPFEVVIVDDASRDGTLSALRDLLVSTPELVVIALRRNFGQTLALLSGLDRARGNVVVTMDGDLQNDPRDIPMLLQELSRGADVVSGWRRQRRDSLFSRRIPSWIANWLIRLVTGAPIHDQGCALKAYRCEIVRTLDLYADMHRLIGLMTLPLGASLVEVEVHHRPRVAGSANYGASRIFKVLVDLFTVQMLSRFQERPSRWFAILGCPFLATALLALPMSLVAGSAIVPGSVALIAATTFGFCLLLGVLGEAALESSLGGADSVPFRDRADT
jgi:glycosyltransferase involved in cell wall biosynthesis